MERAAPQLPLDLYSWNARRLLYFHSRGPDALDLPEQLAVRAELDFHKEALDEAQALADKPRGRHALVLGDQPWTPAMAQAHVVRVSLVVNLLSLDAVYRADAQDREGAVRSCRGAINAARSLGDEPFVISQLMRKNQATVAIRGIQYLLNRGECEPETLADLQHQLEVEADHPGFLIAMRGHRALLHEILTALEAGRVGWDQIFPDRPHSPLLDWTSAPSRDEIRRQHAEMLLFLGRMIEAAAKPSPERAALLRDLQPELDNGQFPLLAPPLRELPGLEERFAARDAHLRCAAAAVACERYRSDHGCWPTSLEVLTPDYLKETPLDPANGKPLRYQRLDDNVVISSRCLDDRTRDRPRRYNPDDPTARYGVMVRLWDVSQRGRPKPPMPPEPEPRRP